MLQVAIDFVSCLAYAERKNVICQGCQIQGRVKGCVNSLRIYLDTSQTLVYNHLQTETNIEEVDE